MIDETTKLIKEGEKIYNFLRAKGYTMLIPKTEKELYMLGKLFTDPNLEIWEIKCVKCETVNLVYTIRNPGFSDYEEVECENCGETLGEFRCDTGCHKIAYKTLKKGG